MKAIGFDQSFYFLSFEHRGSLETEMFGWHGDFLTRQ